MRPFQVMLMGDDEEVSPQRCEEFAKKARNDGDDLKVIVYPGASHNFDDPSQSKQSNPANRKATEETHRRAEAFFAAQLLKSEVHPESATEAFNASSVQPALIWNAGGVSLAIVGIVRWVEPGEKRVEVEKHRAQRSADGSWCQAKQAWH